MSIQSEINRIAGAKSDIADAIEDMGGTLSPGASIDDLAAGVRTIPQGSGGTTDANDVTYDSSETYDSGTVGAALNEQRNTLNSEIATRQTYVRPNLLDNWYFGRPVNQRGQSSYSNTNSYTIDRWKLTSGSVAVVSGGITLNGTLVQILEASIGQAVTASALLSDGTMITPTYNDTTKTFTLTATGQTIKAVKLELGSGQTLCHNEGTDANPVWALNEIPNSQQELAKCQRYYYRIAANESYETFAIGIFWDSNSHASFLFNFPVTMASAPTPRYSGEFFINSTQFAFATHYYTSATPVKANINFTASYNVPNGTLAALQAGGNGNTVMEFSVDL